MHSYEGPSGRTYHHTAHGSINDVVHFEEGGRLVTIEMRDLMWMVADFIRDHKIGKLEGAKDADILGLND